MVFTVWASEMNVNHASANLKVAVTGPSVHLGLHHVARQQN